MDILHAVDGHDLARMDARTAVAFLRDMLWAEMPAGEARIRMPSMVDAPDGGIDGTVIVPDDAPLPDGPSALRRGLACYQVKTGKTARITHKRVRDALLFGPARRGADVPRALAPRVRDCLEKGGTLVFVLFGVDVPPGRSGPGAEGLLRRDLAEACPEYADARVEVWQQDELIGHLGRHPALRRRLKGTYYAAYQDHFHWGENEDMKEKFVKGRGHDRFAEKVLARLSAKGGIDVRIAGPPGSGKTRIVHEITREGGLAPRVLYFENPAPLRDGGMLDMLVEDRAAQAILVVDECGGSEWERLRNRTSATGGRIGLVTIHNEKDAEDALDMPELGEDEIRKIIRGHGRGIKGALLDDLARWCTPSPRYAHRIGERVGSNLRDFLDRPLDEKRLHREYIAGGLDLESGDYRRREAVLLWFGLFTLVGHDRPYSEESAFLAAHLKEHMNMPIGEFDSIVADLRDLKILQGYKSLYVAPALLHWWLWREWWERNGRRFDFAGIVSAGGPGGGAPMPESLLGRLVDMFANASSSKEATEAAADMLADGGMFGDGRLLDDRLGARLFHSLSLAVPDAALRLLVGTVGAWGDGRLAEFRTGRRHVVQALEEMARHTANFKDVVGVLLRLAANENESAHNSAAGVLARLFSMAPDALAATPTGAGERLALLSDMLDSADKRLRLLALGACDEALEPAHFARMDYGRFVMDTAHVVRPDPSAIDAYGRVLEMLIGRMGRMEEDERTRAVGIILKRAVVLSHYKGISGKAADAIRFMHDQRLAGKEKLLEAVTTAVRTGGGEMGKESMAVWASLESDMSGGDYCSRMRRYVGMRIGADVAPGGAGGGGPSRSDGQIRSLAAETLRDGEVFAGVSEWIFGPGVENAMPFGDELGRQDEAHAMLERLLKGASNASDPQPGPLLGGYLAHVFRRDEGLWEDSLDLMAGDARLAPSVPEATRRSGMTDRAWDRLASLHARGAIEKRALVIFACTGRACKLSDKSFGAAVGIMLDSHPTPDIGAALALLAGRCRCSGPRLGIPLGAARRAVADRAALSGTGGEDGTLPVSPYDWSAVAMRLVEDDSDGIPALADALFGAMGSGGGVFDGSSDEALRVLDRMAAATPECVWESASRHAVARHGGGPSLALQWAGGILAWPGTGKNRVPPLLDTVPLEAVWEWVDGDRKARVASLARSVPKTMVKGRRCIARDILVRYGEDRGVRLAMLRHFLSGQSFGSSGDHFSRMKRKYAMISEREDDPNVCRWLGEMIKEIDWLIDKGRASDERLE